MENEYVVLKSKLDRLETHFSPPPASFATGADGSAAHINVIKALENYGLKPSANAQGAPGPVGSLHQLADGEPQRRKGRHAWSERSSRAAANPC